ncbi:DinB family protein [Bacillus mycoides]|uniref:DinB family protein n=1 Tax=Bacillus mycoides TaxID=1405 RepID=UPI0002ED8128|nr:DinB family protein [Bacillus mycoides]AIW82937.1 dinB superfamily protein [Bacillus mycoides]MCQ6566435.1 DinB family protein [Bacillus mycoides]MCU5653949.1 DinB family protein [Bacillus mycoides]MED1286981.1 DinB family protein [Bacillus mycoides]QWH62977.1 DinB family protein [Bacillus mycoides]
MKSENISKHFHTLHVQRNQFLPELHSLSQEQLWHRKEDGKWSIGEHFYHLYLIARMLKVAIKFSFTLIPYAKLRKNAPFATDMHDIYAEYKEKHGKGMKAPWILIPSKKVYYSMNVNELEELLSRETDEIKKLVQNIEEDIAGHIVFLDPIAHYPNLIQSIQLLAIHEKHHFMIMKNNYEMIDTHLKV